jgi:hypothetical protein
MLTNAPGRSSKFRKSSRPAIHPDIVAPEHYEVVANIFADG